MQQNLRSRMKVARVTPWRYPMNCMICLLDLARGEDEEMFCFQSHGLRAIYSVADSYRVSGVGRLQSGNRDGRGRLISPIHENSTKDGIDQADEILAFPIKSVNSDHGPFILHDVCWTLLQTCCPITSVSIDILRAGLYQLSGEQIGWELHVQMQGMPQPLIKHLDAYETVTKKAPPPIPSALVIEQRQKINTAGDPFTSLPFNICLEILRELPVPDFYNLRFTSRTMGQFLFKNTFWKTRFEVTSDRGFLSSLKEKNGKIVHRTNWHDVYCARKEDNTPVRQAAWLRCLYVKELVWQQRQALDLD